MILNKFMVSVEQYRCKESEVSSWIDCKVTALFTSLVVSRRYGDDLLAQKNIVDERTPVAACTLRNAYLLVEQLKLCKPGKFQATNACKQQSGVVAPFRFPTFEFGSDSTGWSSDSHES